MKKIIYKWVLAGVCVLIGFESSAQTLSELIQIALKNNYQILIQKQNEQIARNNNTAGNAGQMPSVDFNGSYSGSLNNSRQVLADNSVREGSNAQNTALNMSLLANWTVFNGFQVYAKKQQLSLLEQIGQNQSKFYIHQTVSDLVLVYYQLVYEKQVLENLQSTQEVSKFRLEIEARKKSVGAGKESDYKLALADFQSDSIKFLAQSHVLEKLKVNLNRILGQEADAKLIIKETEFPVFPPPSKDSLFLLASQNNAALNHLQLEELRLEIETRLAASTAYPQVDLFAGYQYGGSTAEVGFIKSNQNFGPTLGLRVNFSLYNGGKNQTALQNSRIYSEQAGLSREDIKKSIEAETYSLFLHYQTVEMQLELAKANVRLMTEVMETSKAQFNQGQINAYEFRLNQQSKLNSEMVLAQLQFTLKSIEINLNRLSGEVLDRYMGT